MCFCIWNIAEIWVQGVDLKRDYPEVTTNCSDFKFADRGQRNTPVPRPNGPNGFKWAGMMVRFRGWKAGLGGLKTGLRGFGPKTSKPISNDTLSSLGRP